MTKQMEFWNNNVSETVGTENTSVSLIGTEITSTDLISSISQTSLPFRFLFLFLWHICTSPICAQGPILAKMPQLTQGSGWELTMFMVTSSVNSHLDTTYARNSLPLEPKFPDHYLASCLTPSCAATCFYCCFTGFFTLSFLSINKELKTAYILFHQFTTLK